MHQIKMFMSIGSRIISINTNHLKIDLKGLLGDLQFIVVNQEGNNNNNKYHSVVGDGINYSTQELVFLKISLFLKNNDILLMILYKLYLLLYCY